MCTRPPSLPHLAPRIVQQVRCITKSSACFWRSCSCCCLCCRCRCRSQSPKSSSVATVGRCVGLLIDDIGAPHAPKISLGAISARTRPRSTLGSAGFAATASDTPQELLSGADAQGSNIELLLCGTAVGRAVGATDFGADVCREDRLKAELNFPSGAVAGEITSGAAGAGVGAGAGVEDANPPKSLEANRSVGIDLRTGLGAGAGTGGAAAAFWIRRNQVQKSAFVLLYWLAWAQEGLTDSFQRSHRRSKEAAMSLELPRKSPLQIQR